MPLPVANVPEGVKDTVVEWLFDLLGFIGLGMGATRAAAAGELQRLEVLSLHDHGDVPLAPTSLAEAVVKHSVGVDWARDEARKGGMTHDNFDVLVQRTGNPPGPETLLDLLRRGVIDSDRAVHGFAQGYLKDEWSDDLLALRVNPLPLGEAVEAVVQNHVDVETGAAHAADHGYTRGLFDILVANAGNPPGPQELLSLWVRGYIDEATVDQGLRESRIKDKWIPALKNLAVHKLPMRTITTLITHGAMDDATAIAHLRELGFAADDAAALVKSAHFQKATAARQLTVAQIRDLYAQHAINRDQAVADLVTLRYPRDVADQIMALADIDSRNAAHKAAISKVRAAYDARRITRVEAGSDLDVLNVDPAQRAALLDLWDTERAVNVRQLSEAQIMAAGRAGVLTPQECHDRLTTAGYSDGDARILLVIGKVVTDQNQQLGG